MNQTGAAVRFVGGTPGNFCGHGERSFDGHADLQRSRTNKEEAATGNIRGFREMIDGGGRNSQRAETQRDTNTKTFALSTF